jgi:hypothetical protein
MQQEIILPHGFETRHYQRDLNKAIFIDKIKHIIQVLHRRGGKTLNMMNVWPGLVHQRVGLYLHTFPELKQARRVIWNGFDSQGKKYLDYIPTNLIKRVDNQDMLIEFRNGSILQMAGTDRYDSLVGSNPVGIVYDEYALQNPLARNLLRPILAENNGIEIFVYTPRGKNHGYKLYIDNKNNPEWYTSLLTIDDTKKKDGSPVISVEMIDELREEGYPEELIQQEFYCSFEAGSPGSFYIDYINSLEKRNRIIDFDIEPSLPVFTFWDLGYTDDMGIIFMQPHGGDLRLINYYHNNNEALKFYWDYLQEFAKEHSIHYDRHFAPHDINVKELGTGKSRYERALELGLKFQIVPRVGLADGIDEVRTILPRCYLHKTNCEHLINSLRDYHRRYDDKNGVFLKEPVHDWSSHGADTMRYMAVGWKDMYGSANQRTRPVIYQTALS